jgi:hypothetical protein
MKEGMRESMKIESGTLGTNTGKDTYLIMNDVHWVYYVFQIMLMMN